MIAVDTNVLLRYLLDDDGRQSVAARRLVDQTCSASNPAFVHEVAVAELVWVLGKKKPLDRKSIAAAIRELVSNEHLHFRDPPGLLAALDAYEQGPANFAEYMIAAQSGNAGAAPTYTFDKDAGKSPGFAIIAT